MNYLPYHFFNVEKYNKMGENAYLLIILKCVIPIWYIFRNIFVRNKS